MTYSPSNKQHLFNRQTVKTTDATVTTIKTINLNLSSVARIWVTATGMRTGGSAGTAGDAMGAVVTATIKNSATGTAAVVGAETVVSNSTDITGAAVHITTSGGTAIVTVTGATNNNVTWNAVIQVTENV